MDQIETIINRDKKTATYKLALLRALCDIAQTSYRQVRWYADDTVSLPLGLIAEKWLYYYWPLLEADKLLPQIRGAGVSIAFSGELTGLVNRFRKQGGLSAFHVAFQSGGLDTATSQLTDSALNQIARTIVTGPVTHAGGALEAVDRFFWHQGAQTAAKQCGTPDGLVNALGQVHFRAEVWRELCLVGHWIGEAIILRWAELTHKFSKRDVSVAEVVNQLLKRPALERDSVLASNLRDLFGAITGLSCVWTNNPLAVADLAVDHVIPFALWHNNDLWNLVPADKRENNRKRDKLVARDKLIESGQRIIGGWKHTRAAMPQRFDVELNRTLFGRSFAETQWEKPAFAALVEAVETVAIQRGVERWTPGMDPRAGRRRPGATADSATVTAAAGVAAEGATLVPFTELAKDEPFTTALPLVADLPAGPLQAGFEAETLDARREFDWIRVPAVVARQERLVVRVAGDSGIAIGIAIVLVVVLVLDYRLLARVFPSGRTARRPDGRCHWAVGGRPPYRCGVRITAQMSL